MSLSTVSQSSSHSMPCTEPPSLTSLRIKASALMILIQLSHARRGGGGVVLLTTNCTGACMLLHKR